MMCACYSCRLRIAAVESLRIRGLQNSSARTCESNEVFSNLVYRHLPELVFLTPAPVWQKLEPSDLASPGNSALLLHITSLPSRLLPLVHNYKIHPSDPTTDVPRSRFTTCDLFHYPLLGLSFSFSCALWPLLLPLPYILHLHTRLPPLFTPACLLSSHPRAFSLHTPLFFLMSCLLCPPCCLIHPLLIIPPIPLNFPSHLFLLHI